VAKGDIDVAVVWGPLAGYFAARSPTPLTLTPVSPQMDGPQGQMAFDISMGVRKDDAAFRTELEGVMARHRAEIDALLQAYHVPLVAGPAQAGEPAKSP
jgi:mxaJ protein